MIVKSIINSIGLMPDLPKGGEKGKGVFKRGKGPAVRCKASALDGFPGLKHLALGYQAL
jgi:hypothetical protein